GSRSPTKSTPWKRTPSTFSSAPPVGTTIRGRSSGRPCTTCPTKGRTLLQGIGRAAERTNDGETCRPAASGTTGCTAVVSTTPDSRLGDGAGPLRLGEAVTSEGSGFG